MSAPYSMLRRLLCLCCALGWVAPMASARSFSTVVIDAGHGAHDFGCQEGYLFEKHLALDVARRLQRYLSSRGIRNVMTRSRDYFVPLSGRAAIGNGVSDSIFVSVHVNDSSNTSASGVETFYYSGEGAALASAVHRQIMAHTNHGGNRGVKNARFFVLRHSVRPAILVETGFISNTRDRQRLRDPAYREAMARCIGNGIIEFRRR